MSGPWRRLFDVLDEGVALLDAAGRIVEVNATLAARVPAAKAGEPWHRALFDDPAAAVSSPDARALAADGTTSVVFEDVAFGRRVLVTSRPLGVDPVDPVDPANPVDQFGGVTRALTLRDIDDAFADDRRIERSETLAQFGHMSGALAHQIRNPLAVILPTVQMLRSGMRSDDERADLLRMLEEESRRLEQIVRDLVALARPPDGRGACAPTTVVARAVERARRDDRCGPDHRLVEEYGSADGDIPIGAARLEAVTWNLLDNALDATPRGGTVSVRIDVDVRRRTLVIEVSNDDGRRLAPATALRPEEPFYSSAAFGSGIGLVLARHVVEARGGSFEFTDDRSGGTVVRTIWPLVATSD